jgi:hypothetical protein
LALNSEAVMVIKTGYMVISIGQAISPGMNGPPATIPTIEKIRRVRWPRLRMSILARGRATFACALQIGELARGWHRFREKLDRFHGRP